MYCRTLRWCVCLAFLLCAGCIARYVRIEQKGLTCGDAQHLAVEAVRRMGYTITEATKPTLGVPGVILGSRQDGTNTRRLMVSVLCTAQGTEVEAKSEQGGLAEVNFPAEFRRSFAAAVVNQAPPRPPAEHGVDVLMTLERDGGQEQLGVDLSAVGILPVRVRITNHTSRTYGFNAAGVVMQDSAGARVSPLAASVLAGKLESAAAQRVGQKILSRATVAPAETVSGFLLVPFDLYSRARVELVDRASGESEGFTIDF